MAKTKQLHRCYDCLKAHLIQWADDPIIAECSLTGERDVANSLNSCTSFEQRPKDPEIEHRKKRIGITDIYMTQDEIIKAFEGRWRIKGNQGQINSNSATMSFDEFYEYIKGMCLDFFRTGILLGEGFQVAETFDEQGEPTGQTVIYKHDPVFDTADCGFSEWWEMYGKKIDRGKCEKKWAKLSLAEKQACIAATPAYVASTPDLQYRRHPMTYLNNKSWENQIIPHNNGTNKPTIEQQRRDKLASILTD